MKTALLIFTCARDFALAQRATQTALANWSRVGIPAPQVFWCVHKADEDAARSAAAFDEKTKISLISHAFNAGGTLRYSEAIHGMRGVFRSLFAQNFDAVMKVDSDTLLLRPECFFNPVRDSGCGFVAVRRYMVDSTTLGNAPKERPTLNLCNGCVYVFTKEAFAAIDSAPPKIVDAAIHLSNGHEDLFFSQLATTCDGIFFSQIDKRLCVFDEAKQTRTEKTVYVHAPATTPQN